MTNETYDKLKWVALVFIPAFEVFILTLGKIWNIPYYSEIGATIAACGLFLAAILKRSSDNYYEIADDYDNEVPELVGIDIDGDAEEIDLDELVGEEDE